MISLVYATCRTELGNPASAMIDIEASSAYTERGTVPARVDSQPPILTIATCSTHLN